MELAQKARKLVVTTLHTSRKGKSKILTSCALPLTAMACVDRIITELAVIDVIADRLLLVEIARETTVEAIIAKTSAPLTIPGRELPQF
jgi:3-oxoacid CoA-transferase subunit B